MGVHTVSGLPAEVYTVFELGHFFIPLMRGEPLVELDGRMTAYLTYEDARLALIEFVNRMQV